MSTPKKHQPTESGLYWARQYDSDAWYWMIVHVVGEAPFLRVEQVMNLKEGRAMEAKGAYFYQWGPKIEQVNIPPEEIKPRA